MICILHAFRSSVVAWEIGSGYVCRKALCDCLRGCHFLEFLVALCPFKNKGMLMKVKIMLLNDEIFHR